MLGPLSEKALGGLLNNDQTEIARKCLDEMETLLEKNTDYGSSALDPPCLAPDVPASLSIRMRMSDKIKRILRLAKNPPHVKAESFEDACRDFAGYVKLYLVARDREHAQEESQKEAACFKPDPEQGRPQSSKEGRPRIVQSQEVVRQVRQEALVIDFDDR